jgi:hypothetical protein
MQPRPSRLAFRRVSALVTYKTLEGVAVLIMPMPSAHTDRSSGALARWNPRRGNVDFRTAAQSQRRNM